MSRHRERDYLDQQSFHYQEHDLNHSGSATGHHWRGNDNYYSNHGTNRDLRDQDGRTHVNTPTLYEDRPYTEGGYSRERLPQHTDREFLHSSAYDVLRDSVFNRLDHITRRLGPEGPSIVNYHQPVARDPSPLFKSNESGRFDHTCRSRHATEPARDNHWSVMDNRESAFGNQMPPSPHRFQSNAHQYPASLLEDSHRHYHNSPSSHHYSPHQNNPDMTRYKPFHRHENLPYSQAHREHEPLFRPSEQFDHHLQANATALAPLQPLFPRPPNLFDSSCPTLIDSLISRGSPPQTSLFPSRERSPPPLRGRSPPGDAFTTGGSPPHPSSPFLLRERSLSPFRDPLIRRGSPPGPSSLFPSRGRSPPSRKRSPLPRKQSPRFRERSLPSRKKSSPPRERSPSLRKRSPPPRERSHSSRNNGSHIQSSHPSPPRGSSSHQASHRGTSPPSHGQRSPIPSPPSSPYRTSRGHKRSPTRSYNDDVPPPPHRSRQSRTKRSSSRPDSDSPSDRSHQPSPVVTACTPPLNTAFRSASPTKHSKIDGQLTDQQAHSLPTHQDKMENELYSSIQNQQRMDNITRWFQGALENFSDNVSHDVNISTAIDKLDSESTCSSTLGLKIVVQEDSQITESSDSKALDVLFECDNHEVPENAEENGCVEPNGQEHNTEKNVGKIECIEISDIEGSDESGEEMKPELKMETVLPDQVLIMSKVTDSEQVENSNPSCEVVVPSVTVEMEKPRPESPESGEIIDSEEEKEEGEIKDDTSDEKEMEPEPTHQRRFISPFISRFIRRRFSPPPRNFNRSRDDNERWRTPRRHGNYRYGPNNTGDRRKRRHSSSRSEKEDEEKELLLLRTAALETMIVRPRHSSTEPSPTKASDTSQEGEDTYVQPSTIEQQLNEVSVKRDNVDEDEMQDYGDMADEEDQLMAVDMELVSMSSGTSRDHTPEVSTIPSTIIPNDTSTTMVSPSNTTVSPLIDARSRASTSCVKVITNNNSTWKVSNFNIVVSEGEEEIEDGIGDMIQLYRQAAEAKASGTDHSLSSLKMELKECEEEIEQEELKLDLLEQQLKASQQKILKLKEHKLEVERKIQVINTLVEPKVPVISVDPPPSTGAATPTSAETPPPSIADPVVLPPLVDTTISGPSSTLTSRSSSPLLEGSSPVPNPENETSNSSTAPPGPASSKPSSLTINTTSATLAAKGKTDKHKQLIDLVAARQSNIAHVKGLLSMIERNQRKRRNNLTQPTGEKVTKHSLASFANSASKQNDQTIHVHASKQSIPATCVLPKESPTSSSKENSLKENQITISNDIPTLDVPKPSPAIISNESIPGFIKGSDELHVGNEVKVSSQSTEHTTNTPSSSSTAKKSNMHLPTKGRQKKKPSPLEGILKQLKLKKLEEEKITEWFDHITSSTISSSTTSMPRPLCSLSPIGIAINFFFNNSTSNSSETDHSACSSSIRKVLAKPDKTQLSIKDQPSFIAYESSLLKFRSYRLSPLYRTLFKQPLSSLTHSNTIDPNVIMCHHESQGQCKDKACKAQHFADVMMTHDDIINDITRYVPTEKIVSIREKLSKFTKLENDQFQTMTAHVVSQELSHDDHVTISNHWQQNKIDTKPSKPADHQSTPKQRNDLEPFKDMFEETATNTKSDGASADNFRYFLSETTPTPNTTPSNLIASVCKCTNVDKAFGMIEKGIELFPKDETIWMEYLQRADESRKITNKLFMQAIESVPTYNMYKEVIKLSAIKNKWILTAIKHFVTIEDTTSRIVLELILSYCNLSIMQTGSAKESLDFLLNFNDEVSEELVMKKLCTEDKVFLGLVHLYLLYAGSLPAVTTGFHGNTIPITITETKNFLIPFTDHNLSQDAFDDMMSLFRRYLKNFTDSSSELSTNILNCLPLYINLFYFEITQGNSSTTIVSIDRLLRSVPDTRELLVMKAYLDNSSTTLIKGTDPLVYFIQARKCLLKNNDINEAVKLLSDCIRGYYIIPDTEVEQYDPCMLYRKLLHYQIPYDARLPPTDDQYTIPSDCPSLCLNYCLLVELTAPAQCTEVFETSLYYSSSVMWMQFIQYMAHLFSQDPNMKNARQLLEVCQRFTLSLRSSTSFSTDHLQEYAQMLDVLVNCVESPEDKVLLLKHVPIYDSPTWVYMFCQYSECLEQVRSILAQYLTKFPHHLEMWLIGISIEMKLGNFRQARWMFNRAVQYIPHSSRVWTQFLLFELAGMVKQYSIPPLIQGTIQKLNKYGKEFKLSILISVQSFIN